CGGGILRPGAVRCRALRLDLPAPVEPAARIYGRASSEYGGRRTEGTAAAILDADRRPRSRDARRTVGGARSVAVVGGRSLDGFGTLARPRSGASLALWT